MPRPCRSPAMPCRVNSHMPYSAPAVLLPCRAALIHTCHAVPLPFSNSAVKVRVVAGRSRKRAGRPHAVSGRPMLIHTCHAHAALYRGLEKSISKRHGRGMARARHGMCKSNTAALCKSNGKDTIYILSGTAWYV
jgi:hypothetical protein